MELATSKIPNMPTVVLIKNLPVLVPAVAKSPWRILFGIVTRFDKLDKEVVLPNKKIKWKDPRW